MNGPGVRGKGGKSYEAGSNDFRFKGTVADKNGSADLRAELDRQMRLLRAWEDPADTSSTAVVYREMLATAEAVALAGGRPRHGWGEYGACGDPRKQRKAATA